MQGCCCALALAERDVDVILFDRNQQLLSRAGAANEGKVHLGYMYANDPSYSTARMMMNGALAFAPFIARHLGIGPESLNVSQPAAYVVRCDSQRSAEEVAEYLATVHSMIVDAADGRSKAYFGKDLSQKPRPWSATEREAEFDCEVALAAFDTPEVAINPVTLAKALRERIYSDRRIEVRLAHEVLSVEDIDAPVVIVKDRNGAARHHFDHTVNALWDGRLAVDETLGLRPIRPWLHRLKYGVSFYLPENTKRPRSATFVSGPFGEIVNYNDGLIYLTWYPVCLLALTSDIAPPHWPTYPDEQLRSELLKGTLEAMSEFVVSLRQLALEELENVTVKGGTIVAWGETDIHDPKSELHRRYEIGVTSNRKYHSIDPGKLTMAPYFAQVCSNRILNGGPL
jgi:glycine/D-amino acid oxidase-like deaminating enzyme